MTAYMDIDFLDPTGDISEETLGAYLEGNLSDGEEAVLDAMLVSDTDTALMLRDIVSDFDGAHGLMPDEYETEVRDMFAGLDDNDEFFITEPVGIDAGGPDIDSSDCCAAAEPEEFAEFFPDDSAYTGDDGIMPEPMPGDISGDPDFF